MTGEVKKEENDGDSRHGIGVDYFGNKAFDPSANVRALNNAANRRQDDLRKAVWKLYKSETKSILREMRLRATHDKEIREAEGRRIDAIRTIDTNAVAVASQRSGEQASALAAQVATSAEVQRNQTAASAEALRALVATTAATALANQQQQFAALTARIGALEQSGAERQGKQSLADPQFAELLMKVSSLAEANKTQAGVGQGVSTSWGVMIAIAGLAAAWFVAFGPGRSPPSSPAPQIIYSPAPLATPAPPVRQAPREE